jgi:hypothetical protein
LCPSRVEFCGGRKAGEPGEKPLVARERTNKQLNAHEVPEQRIILNRRPIGSQRWEVSVLPQRHPCHIKTCNSLYLHQLEMAAWKIFLQGRKQQGFSGFGHLISTYPIVFKLKYAKTNYQLFSISACMLNPFSVSGF